MKEMDPCVSVVMSVYNGEKYLREAVESILAQDFPDFEFIIVNDGSTDLTAQILDSYDDPRIVRIKNEQNRGAAVSRNRGIAAARGEYVAIMDADDVSLPQRLSRQVEFLRRHPEIGVLGSNMELIDATGKRIGRKWNRNLPCAPEVIEWHLLFQCPIAHPSTLLRRNLLNRMGTYRTDEEPAEDYGLWTRLTPVTQLANLDEVLGFYRLHGNALSVTDRRKQLAAFHVINAAAVAALRARVPMPVDRSNAPAWTDSSGSAYQKARNVLDMYRLYMKANSKDAKHGFDIQKDAAGRILYLARKGRRSPRFLLFLLLISVRAAVDSLVEQLEGA